jgi:hypothetical protein
VQVVAEQPPDGVPGGPRLALGERPGGLAGRVVQDVAAGRWLGDQMLVALFINGDGGRRPG